MQIRKSRTAAKTWIFIAPILLLLSLLSACQQHNALTQAYEVYTLNQLKKYVFAQNLLYNEYGRLAPTLSELYQSGGYGEIMGPKMLAAWYRAESPTPLKGYLYADVSGGQSVEGSDSNRIGLVAYPAKSGILGGRAVLVLINMAGDPKQWSVSGDSARIFFAKAKDLQLPLTQWPSAEELKTQWQEQQRLTPRQGLRKAQEVYDKHLRGR